jgi:hypothetical protein
LQHLGRLFDIRPTSQERRMLHQSTAGQVAGPSTELELVNYGAGYA